MAIIRFIFIFFDAFTVGVQIYPMDTNSSYNSVNPLTESLVVGTRNLVWAKSIPSQGKGIIFGGKAHFDKVPSVQFFYAKRNKARKLVEVDFSVDKYCIVNNFDKVVNLNQLGELLVDKSNKSQFNGGRASTQEKENSQSTPMEKKSTAGDITQE